MVAFVYGYNHYKAKITYKYIGDRKPLISKQELFEIIHTYSHSPEENLKMLGFFLYLLYVTGQRNETIRTLEFNQFIAEPLSLDKMD